MISARSVAILGAALWLAGSASTAKTPPETWSGGDPAHLAADQAACRAEAANLDVNDPSTYSDPRYGVASAMAASVAQDNPLVNRDAIVRRAVFEICMNDKGWHTPR
jgi:hypothetical protein